MGCIRGTEWGTGGDPVPHKTIILGPKTKLGAPAVSGAPGTFAAGKTRPPRPSLVRAAKSASGSEAKTESLNPPWPSAFPWHPDELHPYRPRMGRMSFSKWNAAVVGEGVRVEVVGSAA